MSRMVSWFSCGAASAVATKLALIDNDVVIKYCQVREEHEDNIRFLRDCEKWFNQEIEIIGNDKFDRSIYKVFEKRRYLSGIGGAPCTLELKKKMRIESQLPDDIQVFGYTCEEQSRVDLFIDANNEVNIITPLIDSGLTKSDCLAMIQDAGIELPAVYKLGYKNNNCLPCVKAQSPAYFLKIKQDFPERFERMAEIESRFNVRLIKYTKGKIDYRCKLTEIPDYFKPMDDTIDIQCGIFCELAEQEY